MRKSFAVCLVTLLLIAGTISGAVRQNNGDPNIRVWVNTASHVYHCPGSQFYGKTEHGRYMLQKTAQKNGNRPADGKVCE